VKLWQIFQMEIIVNSRKFDGKLHRSWNCELIEETTNYWLLVGKFEHEVNHSKLGEIKQGTISYEYFFKDKYFNIFRFHEPNGELKFYYCNISLLPKFENNVLDFVDLDIDVLVKKDFSFEILDEDEFEKNTKLFNYSDETKILVNKSLEDLIKMIRSKDFPFGKNT
jgi:protein associated with RNAse G/E